MIAHLHVRFNLLNALFCGLYQQVEIPALWPPWISENSESPTMMVLVLSKSAIWEKQYSKNIGDGLGCPAALTLYNTGSA